MQKIFALICALSVSQSAFSQPTIEWDKTIGGNSFEELKVVQQTSDGGYILGGWSDSPISGDKTEGNLGSADWWIVKLNSSGGIQWQNTIGGSDFDELNSIEQTSDGGYILGGISRSNISGDKTENCRGIFDYWIVKLNASGAVQWDKTIGGNDEDWLSSIHQTFDGKFTLGGWSRSNISGEKTENSKGGDDYWVVMIDSSGNILWQKTIGGNAHDDLTCLKQTSDGGYILSGSSGSNISGDKTDTCRGDWDYWIVKIDSVENIQWDKTIGGSNGDYLMSIEQTLDNGYILGGWSESNISGDKNENNCNLGDNWTLKLDSTGNIQWQNTVGSNGDDALYSILQSSDGGYLISGQSDGGISCDKSQNPYGGSTDYWIVKLDTSGGILWDKTIGGIDADALNSSVRTSDGGYLFAGYSYSNISGDKTENSRGAADYWVIKLSPDVGMKEPDNINAFNIFPNPASDEISISESGFRIKEIEIYDAVGRKIYANNSAQNINVSRWDNGIYFIKIFSADKISAVKLVVQH